jgi:CheY-like chemotaxis protein
MKLGAARPARVLLVDDDIRDIELTTTSLAAARLAVQLEILNSGEEALAYLRGEGRFTNALRPDLVLLDVKMPGISGIETLHEIKNDPRLRQLPVVMLTSSTIDEDILRSYTEQAHAYMTKPIDADSFKLALQRLEGFWLTLVVVPRSDV